ncbi:embryonic protein UVS.2-like isoform X1 [Pleurodeles waltl]
MMTSRLAPATMQLSTSLLASSLLLGWSLGLPLPANETADVSEGSNGTELDIVDRIIRANRGIKVSLDDIDILLISYRNALQCPKGQCLWPQSSKGLVLVPYVLDSVYDSFQRSVFSSAMQEMETMTCINFEPRSSEKEYLHIISTEGCYTSIGRSGGVLTVGLDTNGCIFQGLIQHELMHSLGFYHEHSRTDRDTYIDIIWKYIDIGDRPNFAIQKNGNTLDLPYDYNSVMHYGRTALSNTPGQATIIPKPDPTVIIGQKYGLSSLDVAKINKLYNCNLCRTLLTNPSGSITINPSTRLTPNVGSCLWLVRIPDNQVFLWVSDFNIKSSVSCKSNYIRVYDGNSKSSPVILDNTCGQGNGLSLLSSGSTMLVEYVYSSQSALNTFNAIYDTGNCGGVFTKDTGTVTSPNYPYGYPRLTVCTWTIVAPPGYKISLNMVTISFPAQSTCTYNSLSIYDDAKPYSNLLGTYCTQAPGIITSYGNTLRLVFKDAFPRDNNGFLVTYTFFKFPILLTDQKGTFSSPSYPSPCANNATSLWLIQLPAKLKVSLWFDAFNIRSSAGCLSDYVMVYDGDSQSDPILMAKTCGGSIPCALTASSNQMLVEFAANWFVAGNGFQASYGSALPWVTLTSTSGVIFPANYQIAYPNFDGSLWLIQVPSNQILLDFSAGGRSSTSTCVADSIKVYNGPSRLSPVLLAMTCASGLLPLLVSSGPSLLIEFIKNRPILPINFSPSYSTVRCGATYTSNSGIVSTPGYPENYPDSTDCTWTIIAPVGFKIIVTIRYFHVENNPICAYDYLMIYNGGSLTSSVFGKFCGNNQIPPLTSRENAVILQFHSDENTSFPGFEAKYSFV